MFFTGSCCRSLELASALAIAAIIALCSAAAAQDEPKSRQAYLLEEADRIKLTLTQPGEEPVELQRQNQAALKFTNPLNEGQAAGLTLLWLDGDMPVVASSLYIRKNQELFREFASLIDAPLIATREGAVIWLPAASCFARRTLPEAPLPADNPRLRLTQMKRAAERFSVKDMRLLPTPLHRYQSKKYGVVDGAIFALVRATDPDVLVLIEAVEQDDGAKSWRYAIGRMHSMGLQVKLDGQEICSFAPYWRSPSWMLPYVEQSGGKVPEEVAQPAP